MPFALCPLPFALSLLLALTAPSSAQVLAPSPQTLPGLWSGSLAWGDYDNDGDPDPLLTGLTGPADNCVPIARIYTNNGGALTDLNADLTGIYLGAAAWGDYDGDGDLDLALSGLTAQGQGTLKIYENDNRRFVEDLTQSQLVPVRYSALAWGDYDGDGDLDLVVSGMTAGGRPRTTLYRNSRIDRTRMGSPLGGQPVLEVDDENTQRLTNFNQGALAWGDYDGDGDLDLVLSGFSAGGVRQSLLYRNDPLGELSLDVRNIEQGGIPTVSGGDLAWADVDNDGDLDLALSGWSSGWEATFELYTNAAGILSENVAFSSTRIIGALAWADYDNDGDLDLAATGQSRTSDRFAFVLPNNPTGTLRSDFAQNLEGLRGGDLAWADVEGDGDLDLLLSGEDADGVRQTRLYTSSGVAVVNTRPNPPSRLGTAIVTGSGVSLNWNDGTDAQPLALTYTLRIGRERSGHDVFSGAVPVGPGNVGSTNTVQLAIPLARDTYYWSVRAVDGGFLASNESQEEIFRVEDLVSSLQILRPLRNSAMAWGDYDNDGDPDLALAGRDIDGFARTFIYRNLDDIGLLNENTQISLSGVQSGDIGWGDLDNDGDLDLALTGADAAGNQTTHLFLNRLESEDFALIVSSRDSLPQLESSSLAWGDYDNDGDLDLALMGIILRQGRSRIAGIYRNSNGQFSADAMQTLTPMDNGDMAWGDYDNDGDLDLATVGQINNQNQSGLALYQNDPVGTLTADTRSALTGLLASSLAWGDYDNDGDLDLAVCGFDFPTRRVTEVYENNGAGVFSNTGFTLPGVAGGDLAWGDYDNDGDLDLVLVGEAASGRILHIYRNQPGSLDRVPINLEGDVLVGVDFAAATWADYDGDGDLDLASWSCPVLVECLGLGLQARV